MKDYQPDHEIKPKYDIATPVIFLILFVLFVYGSLIVGMLGLSHWMIRRYELPIFLSLGDAGIILMVLCLLLVWLGIALIATGGAYFWLRRLGYYRRADKAVLVIMLILFHIFSTPFILWRMIRQNSPVLRRRHHQRLRNMVKNSKKIEERRMERAARKKSL